MAREIRRVAVIGAGLMGHGIALEFAAAGYEVRIQDVSDLVLQKALRNTQEHLDLMAGLGLMSADAAGRARENLHATTKLEEAAAGADLVIEAAVENLPLKQSLFARLDALTPTDVILASNSSSFMPSQVGEQAQHRERILVTHYFNPPYLLPLVEVVRGPDTSDAVVNQVMELYRGLGKQPALVRRETPGFIGNRLQIALLREALSLVEQGIAAAEDVDRVVKYGFGRRLAAAGVFEVFEAAGWDVVSAVYDNLVPHLSASNQPSTTLDGMVRQGSLGLKTLRGFYDWTPESAAELTGRIARALAASAETDQRAPGP
jgi:3-hydroxybutyryl-CoA dehydrogenase